MSTATYDRPHLYAVPAPPEQKAQYGLLLTIRRRARQAFDTLLALPRGAAGWALRHLRTLIDGVGENRLLSWVSARLRAAAGLVQGTGMVPLGAAVLTTPPVWEATVRLAQAAGSALTSLGRGLWARVKGLLGRSGATGTRVAQALSQAGAALAGAAHAVLAHPAAQAVLHAAKNLLSLVRPVSQSVVTHRLLALLVPAVWLRVALEVITLPLLLAPGLPGAIRSGLSGNHSVVPVAPHDEQPGPAEPAMTPPADTEADDDGFPTRWDQPVQPQNRAERRAQQQEQARAKRARTHR